MCYSLVPLSPEPRETGASAFINNNNEQWPEAKWHSTAFQAACALGEMVPCMQTTGWLFLFVLSLLGNKGKVGI